MWPNRIADCIVLGLLALTLAVAAGSEGGSGVLENGWQFDQNVCYASGLRGGCRLSGLVLFGCPYVGCLIANYFADPSMRYTTID